MLSCSSRIVWVTLPSPSARDPLDERWPNLARQNCPRHRSFREGTLPEGDIRFEIHLTVTIDHGAMERYEELEDQYLSGR